MAAKTSRYDFLARAFIPGLALLSALILLAGLMATTVVASENGLDAWIAVATSSPALATAAASLILAILNYGLVAKTRELVNLSASMTALEDRRTRAVFRLRFIQTTQPDPNEVQVEFEVVNTGLMPSAIGTAGVAKISSTGESFIPFKRIIRRADSGWRDASLVVDPGDRVFFRGVLQGAPQPDWTHLDVRPVLGNGEPQKIQFGQPYLAGRFGLDT